MELHCCKPDVRFVNSFVMPHIFILSYLSLFVPLSPHRFYLVSGGVPLIICGVTAAVNIDNYGSGEQAQ